MEKFLEIIRWIVGNYAAVIAAVNAVILALVALFLLIPGEEPEKTLKKIADFIGKFSRK